jgi:hypothetical protein
MSDTTTTSLEAMVAAVAEQIRRRGEVRDRWAERLAQAIEGVRAVGLGPIDVGGHRVSSETVEADCSQWGNRVDYPGRQETALLIDRRWSFGAAPDLGFSDGSNMQYQHGPTRCAGQVVRPAPVAVLSAIASELPTALAGYLAARSAEVGAEIEVAEAGEVRP